MFCQLCADHFLSVFKVALVALWVNGVVIHGGFNCATGFFYVLAVREFASANVRQEFAVTQHNLFYVFEHGHKGAYARGVDKPAAVIYVVSESIGSGVFSLLYVFREFADSYIIVVEKAVD